MEYERHKPLRNLSYKPRENDGLIVQYPTTGITDCAPYEPFLEQELQKLKNGRLAQKSDALWRKYRDNFSVQEDEFISEQEDFVRENWRELGISQVVSTLRFLEQLDHSKNYESEIKEAIDHYVFLVGDRADPLGIPTPGLPPDIIDHIKQKLVEQTPDIPVQEAVDKLTQHGGWNESDLKFLKNKTKEDFLLWMETGSEDWMLKNIKTLRKRIAGMKEGPTVLDRLDEALREIASKSTINRQRVEQLVELKLNEKSNEDSAPKD